KGPCPAATPGSSSRKSRAAMTGQSVADTIAGLSIASGYRSRAGNASRDRPITEDVLFMHVTAENPPPQPAAARRRRRFALSSELQRFLVYVLRYKPLLIASLIAGILKFSLMFGFPALTGLAVDRVAIGNGSEGVGLSDAQRITWLWWISGLTLALVVSYAVATYLRDFLTGKLGFRVIADLRQDLFDHLHRLSLHFYSKERTGSILSRIITDIAQASNLVNGGVVAVVMDVLAMFL